MDNEQFELVMQNLGAMFVNYSKWQRVQALGQAAEAAKNTKAGHRVYLRCMSMLEIELGVDNGNNAEVSEGFLDSLDRLVARSSDEMPEESPLEEEEM
jgi:hypothetical protein